MLLHKILEIRPLQSHFSCSPGDIPVVLHQGLDNEVPLHLSHGILPDLFFDSFESLVVFRDLDD